MKMINCLYLPTHLYLRRRQSLQKQSILHLWTIMMRRSMFLRRILVVQVKNSLVLMKMFKLLLFLSSLLFDRSHLSVQIVSERIIATTFLLEIYVYKYLFDFRVQILRKVAFLHIHFITTVYYRLFYRMRISKKNDQYQIQQLPTGVGGEIGGIFSLCLSKIGADWQINMSANWHKKLAKFLPVCPPIARTFNRSSNLL